MAWGTRRRYGAVAAACLVALGATACAQETGQNLALEPPEIEPEPDAEAGTPADTLTLVWSTEGQHFATRPVVTGDAVVALAADQGRLSLVAYDPATGAELWRRPSTASSITPGVAFSPLTDGASLVFHMVPGRGDGASIEAVDVATGEPVWQTEEARDGFRDSVRFCEPRWEILCVSTNDGGSVVGWEIDAATGGLIEPPALRSLAARAVIPPPGAGTEPTEQAATGDRRALGGGLYDLLDSRDIALVVDGEIVWQKSPRDLFDGESVSPDYGWMVRPYGDLLVLWLGADTGRFGDGEVELPVQYTAGIDPANGEARWVAEGGMDCGRLVALDLSSLPADWLRCHTTGTMTVQDQWPVGFDVDNVVEELDPRTGEAVWSFDLGASSVLFDDSQPLVRLDSRRIVLERDDGTTVGLDLDNGDEIDVDLHQVGWCLSANDYEYDYSSTYLTPRRAGEVFAAPCNLAGATPEAPVRVDLDMGVRVGDVFVWMDQAGLHGARA